MAKNAARGGTVSVSPVPDLGPLLDRYADEWIGRAPAAYLETRDFTKVPDAGDLPAGAELLALPAPARAAATVLAAERAAATAADFTAWVKRQHPAPPEDVVLKGMAGCGWNR